MQPPAQDAAPDLEAALALHRNGQLEAAAVAYRAILERDPADANALHLAGLLAVAQGQPDDAVRHIAAALALHPHPAFHASHAAALFQARRFEDAVQAYRTAIAHGSNTPAIQLGLAEALSRLGWLDDAIPAYQAILANDETVIEARSGLANALAAYGQLEQALPLLQDVAAALPNDFAAHNNLAGTLEALGQTAEAQAAIDTAIALAPTNPALRYHRATMQLRAGHLAQAWPGFEARTALDPNDPTYTRLAGRDRWQGEPLQGRTILLAPEQGLGDTIQFARYAKLVAERAGQVVLAVQPPLRALFASMEGVTTLIDDTAPFPETDTTALLMSLPGLFQTTLATIPATIPYLHAPAEAVARWQASLQVPNPSLRVGLVWAGNPHHSNDRQRSIPFDALQPLFQIPDIAWFSLQVGPRAVQGHPVLKHLDLTDFTETAAAIACLDLVIAVDTSTAHLAGALGKPTWLLLPYTPDWRWLRTQPTTPWYPTLRLFRQTRTRTWPPILNHLKTQLEAQAKR